MTRTRNMPRYDTTVSLHCHFLFLVKISLLKYWPKFRIPNSGQKLAFSIEIYDFLPKFRNFGAKMTNFWTKSLFLLDNFVFSVKNDKRWPFLDRNCPFSWKSIVFPVKNGDFKPFLDQNYPYAFENGIFFVKNGCQKYVLKMSKLNRFLQNGGFLSFLTFWIIFWHLNSSILVLEYSPW